MVNTRTQRGNEPTVMRGEAETEPRGLRELKKGRTHDLIADTALRLFIERGFDDVAVAEIAEAAEVDAKTVYNHFPTKPELVYQGLETFENGLLTAVRERKPGESILSAFTGVALGIQGLLGDPAASGQLKQVSRVVSESPALLAHEQQVFARYTASLAALIAEETNSRLTDIEPWVVANTLMGFHRSLVAYVRRETLAGTPNAKLLRDLRAQAKSAVATLEHGLGNFGIRRS
jgi:AcrR family transcriptional regulator